MASRRPGGMWVGRRSSILGDGQVKNNKKIDTTISSVLFTLPLPAIAPHTQTAPLVLPQRNLLRQLTWGLPSGQAVARAMGVDALAAADLADIAAVYRAVRVEHPAVVLHPGRSQGGGRRLHLGPIGGRIVAETLIGLLRADPTSYLRVRPRISAVPRNRPQVWAHARHRYHRRPDLHPGPLPPLRRGVDTGDLPLERGAPDERHLVNTCTRPAPLWLPSGYLAPRGVVWHLAHLRTARMRRSFVRPGSEPVMHEPGRLRVFT